MAQKKTLNDLEDVTEAVRTERDMMVLRGHGFFQSIISQPDRLKDLCQDYLNDARTPNVAGLAASLGITVQRLVGLFDQKNIRQFEEASLEVLATTLTLIEDSMVSMGILGLYQPHFAKFYLSAFHNRNEKTLSESNNNSEIRIILETHAPSSIEELEEYQRLQQTLEGQTTSELSRIGKAEGRTIGYDGDLTI